MDETQNKNAVTLLHYKEPLIALKKEEGFGYLGALRGTLDGDKIECHICGGLFSELSKHINPKHHISAEEYKERFQLARQTVLISENIRQDRKMRTLVWLSKLTEEQRTEMRRKAQKRFRKYLETRAENKDWNIRLETKNKRGTCPDQILAKITEVKEKLGHTPSLADFIDATGTQRYKHLIFKVYGSWKNALKILNMQPKSHPGSKMQKHRYTREELLEYLTLYAQENQKIPTVTDCKRKLIPGFESYKRHFGNLENARQEAGIYNFLDRSMLRGVGKKIN